MAGERCNVVVGTKPCGEDASNWCYNTDGPKTHNHNVCDTHWNKKAKRCIEPGAAPAAGPAPQQQQQQQRRSGTADQAAPIKGI